MLLATVHWAGLGGTPSAVQLVVTLQTIAVVALLAAAALCVSRWQVDRRAPGAVGAIALVVYALGAVPLGNLVASLASGPEQVVLDEVVRLSVTLVVVLLVATVTRHGGPPTPRRLAFRLVWTLAAGTLLVVSLDRLMALQGWAPTTLDRLSVACDVVSGLAWVALGVVAWCERDRTPWALRAAPVTAGLTLVSWLDAAAGDVAGSPAHLGAMLLWACVAGLVGVCALTGLCEVIDAARRATEDTEAALEAAATDVARRVAWREELSHDAIGALSGLRAALSTMSRYDDRLDVDEARRLREAAIAEVSHLEHLVARSSQDVPVVFDVAEVIGSVAETRRAGGLVVDLDDSATGPETAPGEGLALGLPGDLATVLHNLLINVDAHARGSRVRITVTRGTDQIGVGVVDDGPGIPESDRERVFDRGVRGASSASTGLGLYVARQLMREQGGDLVLLRSAEGCHFLVTMPAASVPEPGPADPRSAPPLAPREPALASSASEQGRATAARVDLGV